MSDLPAIKEVSYVSIILFVVAVCLLTGASYTRASNWVHAEQIGMAMNSIGATVFSISLIGLIYDFVMKRKLVVAIKNSLHTTLEERFSTIKRLEASGIQDAYPEFPLEEVKSCFGEAKDHIIIVQTWVPEATQLGETLCRALSNNCKVDIYVLEPGCLNARQRSKELDHDHEYRVSYKTDDSLLELFNAVGDHPNKALFRVWTYTGTATMAIYRSDHQSFVGLYVRESNSAHTAHFKVVSPDSSYGRLLDKHIEGIMKEATQVEKHKPFQAPPAA